VGYVRTAVGVGHSHRATPDGGVGQLDLERAWSLLCALAERAHRGHPVDRPIGLELRSDGTAHEVAPDAAGACLVARPDAARRWSWPGADDADLDAQSPGEQQGVHENRIPSGAMARVEALLDLYMPLCVGPSSSRLVVGHLAQSLDGRIATESGVSQFISGQADVQHAHRMRALFDAVVVGAGTVEKDDPRLTTRLVPGSHPVRVVIDPQRRLGEGYSVFQDGEAPSLVVCASSASGGDHHGRAEIVPVDSEQGGPLPVGEILDALRARGLERIFIEGGGVTLSRFLAAGALDRLHVAVAPCILGSGRSAFSLPVIEELSQKIAFECRHFAMGPDILFDCELRAQDDAAGP
jgi:diaminohydroxyphosphoribosylaminopyrimidine deaminase / 5-amino-6-(5-phosphoribosylamino)uracil reductase